MTLVLGRNMGEEFFVLDEELDVDCPISCISLDAISEESVVVSINKKPLMLRKEMDIAYIDSEGNITEDSGAPIGLFVRDGPSNSQIKFCFDAEQRYRIKRGEMASDEQKRNYLESRK